MSFTPIVERELRLLARRPAVYRMRMITALGALLIGLGVAFAGINLNGKTAALGRNLFTSITVVAFLAGALAGPILTADCLSEEKRNGTLGLLFLSGLNGLDVVAGKLAALSVPAGQCLLGIFPILSFSFVMGGVTGDEFVRVTLVLIGMLLLSLCSAIAFSAISRHGLRAFGSSVIFLCLFVIVPPVLAAGNAAPGSFIVRFAAFSPATALQLADDTAYIPDRFWWSCAISFILSTLLFLFAGICVRYSWQDKPLRTKLKTRLFGWSAPRILRERALVRHRRLLDNDPLIWVTTRKRVSTFAVWSVVLGAGAISFWGCWPQDSRMESTGLLATFYVTHAVLKALVGWDASRRFADDRDSGALELLLCSPIQERGIWRSWLLGMRRTYLYPMLALGFIEVWLFVAGLDTTGWWNADGIGGIAFAAGFLLFLGDAYALSWLGAWQGVAARNSVRACSNTMAFVIGIPMLVTLAVFGLMGMLTGMGGIPFGLVLTIWFVLGLAMDAAVCGYAMLKFNEEFRAAVAHATGSGEQRQSWRHARKAARTAISHAFQPT